jgi:hypothetical protein
MIRHQNEPREKRQTASSASLSPSGLLGRRPYLSAAVCAFTLTLRITQRDGTSERDAPSSRTPPVPATGTAPGPLHRDVHGRPAACRTRPTRWIPDGIRLPAPDRTETAGTWSAA